MGSKPKIIRSQNIIANSIRIRSPLSSATSCSSSSSSPSSPQPKVPEIMWPKKVVTGEWLAFEKIPMSSTDTEMMTTTTTTTGTNNENLNNNLLLDKAKSKQCKHHQTKHVHFNEHPKVVVFDCVC